MLTNAPYRVKQPIPAQFSANGFRRPSKHWIQGYNKAWFHLPTVDEELEDNEEVAAAESGAASTVQTLDAHATHAITAVTRCNVVDLIIDQINLLFSRLSVVKKLIIKTI